MEMSWKTRIHIVLGIARGVGFLHQRGLVHRDLKPGNVLLSVVGYNENYMESYHIRQRQLGLIHYLKNRGTFLEFEELDAAETVLPTDPAQTHLIEVKIADFGHTRGISGLVPQMLLGEGSVEQLLNLHTPGNVDSTFATEFPIQEETTQKLSFSASSFSGSSLGNILPSNLPASGPPSQGQSDLASTTSLHSSHSSQSPISSLSPTFSPTSSVIHNTPLKADFSIPAQQMQLQSSNHSTEGEKKYQEYKDLQCLARQFVDSVRVSHQQSYSSAVRVIQSERAGAGQLTEGTMDTSFDSNLVVDGKVDLPENSTLENSSWINSANEHHTTSENSITSTVATPRQAKAYESFVNRFIPQEQSTVGHNHLALLASVVEGPMSVNIGTQLYLSPEILAASVLEHGLTMYGPKADVYAFGILMWEVVTCRQPFSELNSVSTAQFVRAIVSGQRPLIPTNPSKVMSSFEIEFWNLATECWAPSPVQRPSFASIIRRLEKLKELADVEMI